MTRSKQFQSTASSQKATARLIPVYNRIRDFNPQLPRRKRQFSIGSINKHNVFQSTASSQKATLSKYRLNRKAANFNPQLPRRKRRDAETAANQIGIFQSTASSQKATANMHNHSLHTCINHSNTHKIIILSASIAVNPIKISNFTSANLPTFYVHF